MDSGWAVVLGAAIATVGSVLAPWVTARWSTRADDRRERRRERAEVVRGLANAWLQMALGFVDDRSGDEADALVGEAQGTITRLATVLGRGDSEVLAFALWVTATAIPEAPSGTWVPVAHWASQQMFEWHWGARKPTALVRDMTRAAAYEVGSLPGKA